MAITFSAKPDTATLLYIWEPPLASGDAISSYTLTASNITIEDDDEVADGVRMFLSGGTNGTTGSIAASVETTFGESLKETIYVPIISSAVTFATTAAQAIDFALRPIVGNGGTATTNEKADALEWLNAMLAGWKGQGADVGATLPLLEATVIYAPDEHIQAIKTNLSCLVARQYGRDEHRDIKALARQGLQQIKWANLPAERSGPEYY